MTRIAGLAVAAIGAALAVAGVGSFPAILIGVGLAIFVPAGIGGWGGGDSGIEVGDAAGGGGGDGS